MKTSHKPVRRVIVAFLLVILSWLSIGIGFTIPHGPFLNTFLFLGGVIGLFLSLWMLISSIIKLAK